MATARFDPDSLRAILPTELAKLGRWLLWRPLRRGANTTKVPVQVDGRPASSTDPGTWTDLETALAALPGVQEAAGPGIALGDGLVGLDLDGCRKPDTGELAQWAQGLLDRLPGTYAEVSPSGKGVKLWALTSRPLAHSGRKAGYAGPGTGLELYDRDRYFTVTGEALLGREGLLADLTEELAALCSEVWPPAPTRAPQPVAATLTLADQDLLDRALSARNGPGVRSLWEGDTSSHGSHSEADLALCSGLAFWAGPGGEEQVDRLFRQSGLYRPKWEREDYRADTLARAFSRTDFYQARPQVGVNGGLMSLSSLKSPSEEEDETPLPSESWPAPLEPEALHGFAGEVLATIGPHTEADPAAILFQFLVAFGSAAGRNPHWFAESDRHGVNLFLALVGRSSRGRKGTSWGHVLRLFGLAAPDWQKSCVASGLSSGEGLIWRVRDPLEKQEPVREKGSREVTGYQTVTEDEGISDKRLLVEEPELASVLKVLVREGNNLSALLRKAWDGGVLQSLTKNSPARATGAHVSIVSHVTKPELLRYLDCTEYSNGFANRFLWACVRKSKLLPHGGHLEDEALEPLAARLAEALTFAQQTGTLSRTPAARKLWEAVYPALAADKPGMLGSITARAEAQTMRLAALYALLDSCGSIRPEHLEAALAVWTYSEASAAWIFGRQLGNPDADTILRALAEKPEGLSRTEIVHGLFRGHRRKEQVNRALALLFEQGLAAPEKRPTDGRPQEYWTATEATEATKGGVRGG